MSATNIPRKSTWKSIGTIAFLAMLLGLMVLLFRHLASFDYQSVLSAVRGYSVGTLLIAVAFTVLSYLLMGGYDSLGQRYLGKQVNWKKTLLVAFYSYVLSLNIGLSIVSSSAVRYKMYQSWGYDGKSIAKLIVFASVSFWLGLAVLAGLSLATTSVTFDGAYPIPDYLIKPPLLQL